MNPYPQKKINIYKSGLYVVSTPIGNLGDITKRAIEVLKKSNYILCEDTRVSKKLLSTYDISSNLISNHKFNEKKNVQKIINILNSGNIVSIISDAGTPIISDPGRIIVQECIKQKINVFPIPGPSAVTAALSVSGFSEKYFFYGFFPDKKNDLEKLSNLDFSIIFFISAKKINKSINSIKKYFSGRDIVLCKEISKFYEQYYRSSVENLEEFNNIKGEITVVISEIKSQKKASNILSESDKKKIKKLINNFTIKEIITLISDGKNISKKEIYTYCLTIKK
tara:strand:- start:2862 stop:3704 length:843 start_codon:yes stop_codon:yes gene_type:complete